MGKESLMAQPPAELREFLYRYEPTVQSIGLGLRTVVLEEMAPCFEYIFAMSSKVVLLYGSSEKVLADCVCSIAIFRRHATLIFHRGVDLSDPHHLLRGDGKALSHPRRASSGSRPPGASPVPAAGQKTLAVAKPAPHESRRCDHED
jgi:hypothetical protein